eukprot:8077730-Prorocentrum_lima.AAC.1
MCIRDSSTFAPAALPPIRYGRRGRVLRVLDAKSCAASGRRGGEAAVSGAPHTTAPVPQLRPAPPATV